VIRFSAGKMPVVRVGLALLLASCSVAPGFRFHGLDFFDNSASQAQLGNLGIRSSSLGEGFDRGAFLSECGELKTALSVDAVIPEASSLRGGFGEETTLLQMATRLGYTEEEVADLSIVVLSLDTMLLAEELRTNLRARCRSFIEENRDQVRFVTSVAAVVRLGALHGAVGKLRADAVALPRGETKLTVSLKRDHKVTIAPDAVFAYRSSHLCWSHPRGDNLSVRIDDGRYARCPPGFGDMAPQGWTFDDLVVLKSDTNADSDAAPVDTPMGGMVGEDVVGSDHH